MTAGGGREVKSDTEESVCVVCVWAAVCVRERVRSTTSTVVVGGSSVRVCVRSSQPGKGMAERGGGKREKRKKKR